MDTPPSEPLPAGATLRFGTSAYRHGTAIETLTVSRDGNLAVATSGGHVHGAVRAYNLNTGRPVFSVEKIAQAL